MYPKLFHHWPEGNSHAEHNWTNHGLWDSLTHPTVFGHRVDYTLGKLESKSIWTIPKFPRITIL